MSEKVKVESVTPYGATDNKTSQVEAMFDNIASAYDFMNGAMTMGLHRLWLSKALKGMASALQGARVLDVATGTGDVALRMASRHGVNHVTGLDLSEGMLAKARQKLARTPLPQGVSMEFVKGDSLQMPFPDDDFDAITVAYGVRNFSHLEQGLREMYRVLRPGGTIMIIELSEPTGALTKPLYKLYTRRIIPSIGRMVSGDSEAYTYLPASIAACPQRSQMTGLMQRAGFSQCRFRSLTFGAVCIYYGKK